MDSTISKKEKTILICLGILNYLAGFFWAINILDAATVKLYNALSGFILFLNIIPTLFYIFFGSTFLQPTQKTFYIFKTANKTLMYILVVLFLSSFAISSYLGTGLFLIWIFSAFYHILVININLSMINRENIKQIFLKSTKESNLFSKVIIIPSLLIIILTAYTICNSLYSEMNKYRIAYNSSKKEFGKITTIKECESLSLENKQDCYMHLAYSNPHLCLNEDLLKDIDPDYCLKYVFGYYVDTADKSKCELIKNLFPKENNIIYSIREYFSLHEDITNAPCNFISCPSNDKDVIKYLNDIMISCEEFSRRQDKEQELYRTYFLKYNDDERTFEILLNKCLDKGYLK